MRTKSFTMLSLLSLLIIALSFVAASNYKAMSETSLRIMSYNIRYDNPGDGINAWGKRKERVASLIQFYQADLIGLQEVLYGQLTYLEEQLAGYGRIGVGRDDGKQKGEFSPIFYSQEKLELLDQGTFWLSDTPDRHSVGWDASMERIASWGQFRHKASGDTVFFFNTHFDHRGQQAREESARLLLQTVAEQASGYPVFVTGDFNSDPQSVPYRLLTKNQMLRDAKNISAIPHVGPERSYSGFEVTDSLPGERIDYVFVGPDVRVARHAIVTSFGLGYYPSDHLPVVADVEW